jgi:hypothetical protein
VASVATGAEGEGGGAVAARKAKAAAGDAEPKRMHPVPSAPCAEPGGIVCRSIQFRKNHPPARPSRLVVAARVWLLRSRQQFASPRSPPRLKRLAWWGSTRQSGAAAPRPGEGTRLYIAWLPRGRPVPGGGPKRTHKREITFGRLARGSHCPKNIGWRAPGGGRIFRRAGPLHAGGAGDGKPRIPTPIPAGAARRAPFFGIIAGSPIEVSHGR